MTVPAGKTRFQVTFSDELAEKVENYCFEAGITKSAYLSLLAARDLEDTDRYLSMFKQELSEVIQRLATESDSVPK